MADGARRRFDTTRWSLVLAAGGSRSSAAHQALAELCEAYWYPLYAYVRRQGRDPDDARDITQSFFAILLEREDIQTLRPERGRFRAFLLAALRHFLQNEDVRRSALKRGAGQREVSLPLEDAERRYLQEPADSSTPETIFERQWVVTLLSRVFGQVRAEWRARSKEDEFDRLKGCLLGGLPDGGHKELAAQLGSTEAATKMAVHRLKRRFQAELRATIADTVTDDQVDDELRYLLKVLQA